MVKETYRSIVLKVKPDKEQEKIMWKHINYSRFIYNYMLEKYWGNLEKGVFIDQKTMSYLLTNMKKCKEYSFLNEVSRKTLVGKINDLSGTLIRYHKQEINRPKFKSKKKEYKIFPLRHDRIHFNKYRHIKLEKIGYLKISNGTYNNYKDIIEGESFKPHNTKCYFDGKYWYVSLAYKVEKQDFKELTKETIGIDLGLKTLVTCSNGKTYKNINKSQRVKKLEKQLKRKQRQLSRKYEMNKDKLGIYHLDKEGKPVKTKKGSYKISLLKTKNIIKLEKEILLLSRKLKNIRNNHIHTMTKEIVERYPQEIVIEDLKVRNMLKNKHLSKHISKANWYKFREYITYKCEDKGILLTVANTYYPSSQTCSNCGKQKTKQDKLSLKDRTFNCECGNTLDRDLNASLNLRDYRYSKWYKNYIDSK